MTVRVLVVTSCTGEKRYKPHNQLLLEDFQDQARLNLREQQLSTYRCTAGSMYTGRQHASLMKGVEQYRKQGGTIDIAIVSAGYGLLEETAGIVPYEVTFNSMSKTEIRAWSNQIGITKALQKRIRDYDVIFFLLGDKYLEAIRWPLFTTHQKLIFFAGQTTRSKVLKQPDCAMLSIGKAETKRFGSGFIEIKGLLFAKMLEAVSKRPNVWNQLYQRPVTLRELILSTYAIPHDDDYLKFEDFAKKR